tara:strand:+ start:1768 stop:2094 length:327 start_codon:yes stop_codon:yes gene_type:complete
MTTQEITNSCRSAAIAALNLGQLLLFNCPKYFHYLQNIRTKFNWIVDLDAYKAPINKNHSCTNGTKERQKYNQLRAGKGKHEGFYASIQVTNNTSTPRNSTKENRRFQ